MIGMNSDHAEDQKSAMRKLVARRHAAWIVWLGKEEVSTMPDDQRLAWEQTVQQTVTEQCGGGNSWQLISTEECNLLVAKECNQRLYELGNTVFAQLSEQEKWGITLFVWAGC